MTFRAGAATVEINPSGPVPLFGYPLWWSQAPIALSELAMMGMGLVDTAILGLEKVKFTCRAGNDRWDCRSVPSFSGNSVSFHTKDIDKVTFD